MRLTLRLTVPIWVSGWILAFVMIPYILPQKGARVGLAQPFHCGKGESVAAPELALGNVIASHPSQSEGIFRNVVVFPAPRALCSKDRHPEKGVRTGVVLSESTQ